MAAQALVDTECAENDEAKAPIKLERELAVGFQLNKPAATNACDLFSGSQQSSPVAPASKGFIHPHGVDLHRRPYGITEQATTQLTGLSSEKNRHRDVIKPTDGRLRMIGKVLIHPGNIFVLRSGFDADSKIRRWHWFTHAD